MTYESLSSFVRSDGYPVHGLREAIYWTEKGYSVSYSYKGIYVGEIEYGGTIEDETELSTKPEIDGMVFYKPDTDELFLCTPDELR